MLPIRPCTGGSLLPGWPTTSVQYQVGSTARGAASVIVEKARCPRRADMVAVSCGTPKPPPPSPVSREQQPTSDGTYRT